MGVMGVRLINVSEEINAMQGSMYFSRTLQCRVHVRRETQCSWLHWPGGRRVDLNLT